MPDGWESIKGCAKISQVKVRNMELFYMKLKKKKNGAGD